jgi:hypothetical protein
MKNKKYSPEPSVPSFSFISSKRLSTLAYQIVTNIIYFSLVKEPDKFFLLFNS